MTTQSTTTFNPLALPSFAVLEATLAKSAEAGDRAKKATTAFAGVKASVTELTLDYCRELRDAEAPITLGTSDATSTQHVLYNAFCKLATKAQASRMAQLVCWVAKDAKLETLCIKGRDEKGKPVFLGYMAAHKAVAAEVAPSGPTYKDMLEELGKLLKAADDRTKGRAATIPPEAVLHAINAYFHVDPDTEADTPVRQGLLDAMKQSAAQAAAEAALEAEHEQSLAAQGS